MSEFLFTRSPVSTCQCWIKYAESGSFFWSLCTKPTMTFGGKKNPMRLQLPLVKLVKKFCFTFSFSRVDTKCQFSAKRIYECHNNISEKHLLHYYIIKWTALKFRKKKIQIFLWIGQNELPINTLNLQFQGTVCVFVCEILVYPQVV